MEKNARWKPNREIDPDYPFYCRRAADGTIYYSVPLEAPNDIPVDRNAPDKEKYEYSFLPLLGGKNLRVYCWETTDREWALRVRSMINTAHTQERRYSKRYTVVPKVLGDGLDDGNRKVNPASAGEPEEAEILIGESQEAAEQDRGRQNGYKQHGWPEVEKQVMDRIEIQAIRELVKKTNPHYWEVFCLVKLYGEDAKAVAERMGISVQRVHQLAGKVREIAKKYRRENHKREFNEQASPLFVRKH